MSTQRTPAVRDCIEQAKRNVVDCIYSQARIEGIGVTFPETQQIFDGITVPSLKVDEIVKINNMKHAWQFLFDSVDYPLDLRYVRQLNQLINAGLMQDAGTVRSYDVSIGGTSWRPEIPRIEDVQSTLDVLMRLPDPVDRALSVMLYIMRGQIFSDGNKRVAQMAANQILIQSGSGYLKIPVEKMGTFYDELIRYYESGNDAPLKLFLRCNAVVPRTPVPQAANDLSPEMFIRSGAPDASDDLAL